MHLKSSFDMLYKFFRQCSYIISQKFQSGYRKFQVYSKIKAVVFRHWNSTNLSFPCFFLPNMLSLIMILSIGLGLGSMAAIDQKLCHLAELFYIDTEENVCEL